MCGIAGIVKFNQSSVDGGDVKRMTDAIVHRGPDGEGQWTNSNGNVGLGHRRLSIIDLSENGKQPMHYADNRYSITFNGEIYNYIELKKVLLSKGYQFRSESDTEVLMALYDHKKEKCLDELDGMFAFAIWDEKEQILFCARDRFGEKPFYYSYTPENGFYFASEMKALWAAGIEKSTDREMLSIYLQTGNVYDSKDLSRTFYKNIKHLDNAHYLIIKANKQIVIQNYYNLDNIKVNKNITRAQVTEKFYDLLYNSVNLRLRSDVPVGSSLSGGLDSSSIVMLIDKIKGDAQNQNTFSARFSNYDKDEGKHIDEVLKSCKNITGHEVWPQGDDMLTEFDKIIFHQEEPFMSASIYAQWKVMEKAKKEGIIVLLDGQGADEYLAGYLPYYSLYLQQSYFNNYKLYDAEWHSYRKLRGVDLKRFEDNETLQMKLGRYKRKLLNQPMPYSESALTDKLKGDMLHTNLKELLRYADRNAMAHSREVRLPFLSHHLVEFVFSLPDEFKLHEGWTKWILRESMKEVLPPSITWRVDKIGYEPPQSSWLKSPDWLKQIQKGKEIADSFEIKRDDKNDWTHLMISKFFNN
ncbi:MAG: asparagine synthase (glutamine-hydrolyzing) [Bacteroidota bacterium]